MRQTSLRLRDLEGPFQAEVVVPDQFLGGRREYVDTPEIRLMIAVMEHAIATYLEYARRTRGHSGRRGKRLLSEVEDWLTSTDTGWPYSFENICTALGFDSCHVRRLLQAQGAGPLEAYARRPFRRVNGRRHVIGKRQATGA